MLQKKTRKLSLIIIGVLFLGAISGVIIYCIRNIKDNKSRVENSSECVVQAEPESDAMIAPDVADEETCDPVVKYLSIYDEVRTRVIHKWKHTTVDFCRFFSNNSSEITDLAKFLDSKVSRFFSLKELKRYGKVAPHCSIASITERCLALPDNVLGNLKNPLLITKILGVKSYPKYNVISIIETFFKLRNNYLTKAGQPPLTLLKWVTTELKSIFTACSKFNIAVDALPIKTSEWFAQLKDTHRLDLSTEKGKHKRAQRLSFAFNSAPLSKLKDLEKAAKDLKEIIEKKWRRDENLAKLMRDIYTFATQVYLSRTDPVALNPEAVYIQDLVNYLKKTACVSDEHVHQVVAIILSITDMFTKLSSPCLRALTYYWLDFDNYMIETTTPGANKPKYYRTSHLGQFDFSPLSKIGELWKEIEKSYLEMESKE